MLPFWSCIRDMVSYIFLTLALFDGIPQTFRQSVTAVRAIPFFTSCDKRAPVRVSSFAFYAGHYINQLLTTNIISIR